jgi:peptidoglycan/xylan/chitin deacetylase (PgdA/CDA1 family)
MLADQATRVTNLTVHGVGPHTRELDPREAATWIDIAQLEHVLDLAMERPAVRLTFDDGNCSDVHIALPRLVERGLTAEFFPLAGWIGDQGRIDRSGLRELVVAGMSIGSHGWSHRDWRALDDAAAEQEIGLALRVLTDISGQPVSRVAVPFGSYDRTVLRRLRRAGVTRAYTSDGGRARVDAWVQPRTSLRSDLTPEGARILVAGRSRLGPDMRRLAVRSVKRWRGPVWVP